MLVQPGSPAAARDGVPQVVGAALLWLLLVLAGVALPERCLWAQGPAEVIVSERFDPVTGRYRTVVVSPIPVGAVRAIQSALREEGYYAWSLTGELDAATRAALRDFQVDSGLRINGHPEFETLVALGVPIRHVPPGSVARSGRRPTQERAPAILVIGRGEAGRVDGQFRMGHIGVTPGPAPESTSAPAPGRAEHPRPAPAPAPAPGATPETEHIPSPPDSPSSEPRPAPVPGPEPS